MAVDMSLTPRPPLPHGRGGATLPRSPTAVRQAARDARQEPTRSEAILWQALRNRGLGGRKFRRQHPVGSFILDFYCHEERLAVEIDGPIHAAQSEADSQRQQALESEGIRFVRVTAALVEKDRRRALANIEAAFSPRPRTGEGPGERA
ncbi:MAG: DUF559 domain-containing protein [Gammaproteobacteria bacterium]|nr:DUF559 domain-containing protein [Gammaproteobacteria bacterium]